MLQTTSTKEPMTNFQETSRRLKQERVNSDPTLECRAMVSVICRSDIVLCIRTYVFA